MILYRLLISVVTPVLLLRLGDMCARLGFQKAKDTFPRLWIHAASNGELASVRFLIKHLVEHDETLRILITTNTQTARAMANRWMLPRVSCILSPIDLRNCTRRILRNWHVTGLIVVENELWPNRLTVCHAEDIPVGYIGARLSEKSAKTWGKFPQLIKNTLHCITWASAQDELSKDRLTKLGLAKDKWLPTIDLKSFFEPADQPVPVAVAQLYDRHSTILAASTHDGEDDLVLQAFKQARDYHPGLHLILAPRHPKRRDQITALLHQHDLTYVQHSTGARRDATTAVTLADTMGEMDVWYQLASICFVGGSLVDKGGHTPYEPLSYGSAVIHGPSTANFARIYQLLDQQNGAICVGSADQLASAIAQLLDPSKREEIVANAEKHIASSADLKHLIDAITDML
ncbi:3-deoxy-D-manno-octulosonic acid transferase [Pseudaestuariivita rosea]|uniref:3-deoxy-D-manno-octulosonic acid transferase n=1 Tax=Pseudaestuariivita rosea TaxID=2763263 RepID=UPI001ABB3FE3|nr:glycosyltransferase N-terminal domain-containing protein [Pseudaestuariivita rosea]